MVFNTVQCPKCQQFSNFSSCPQVTGTANLTDSCLSTILATNPLSLLRRLVISNPSAQESMVVVPLTARSVLLLHQKCPNLQCLGDLR